MDYQHISFEVASGVARLTFKRPPLNVLNIAMMREINSALDRFDQATSSLSLREFISPGGDMPEVRNLRAVTRYNLSARPGQQRP